MAKNQKHFSKILWDFLKRFTFAYVMWCAIVFFVWMNEYSSGSEGWFFGRDFREALLNVNGIFDFFRVVFVHSWYFLLIPLLLTDATLQAIVKHLRSSK
jgi:hypothetical protein